MTRILAVDWDRHEVRYVLATTKGASVRIRAAASVPLPETDDDAGGLHPELGDTLRTALAGQGTGRAATLVGIDRASVELLHFTLPPASDAELAELVSNEVLRESPAAIDQSVLDFVSLDDDPARPRRVTAAILPTERLEQIRATCAAAGLKPDRVLLRSRASLSLFLRQASPPEDVFLLVNPVADEVELTVVQGGRELFSRIARLPGPIGEQKADERLLGEIKRTLAVAVGVESGGDPVEGVYLFGRADEHLGLLDRIRDELALPARSFDPFDVVNARGIRLPDNPERFASLLGMVLDEARGGRHAIDFLHPRQPPKPIDRRRMVALAAAAVVVAALLGGYFIWDATAAVHAENAALTRRAKELEGLLARAGKQKQLIDSVGGWQAGEVVWLDELREFTLRFPPRRDAAVRQMSMRSEPAGGGTIAFDGLVRDSSVVTRMELSLRGRYQEVSTSRIHEGLRAKEYARRFDTVVRIAPGSRTRPAGDRSPPETSQAGQPRPASKTQ